jgi:hypothetical protein
MGIPGTSMFTYPGEWEMYDLNADPDELNNVFHDPTYRTVRDAMQVKLQEAQAAVKDQPHISQRSAENSKGPSRLQPD